MRQQGVTWTRGAASKQRAEGFVSDHLRRQRTACSGSSRQMYTQVTHVRGVLDAREPKVGDLDLKARRHQQLHVCCVCVCVNVSVWKGISQSQGPECANTKSCGYKALQVGNTLHTHVCGLEVAVDDDRLLRVEARHAARDVERKLDALRQIKRQPALVEQLVKGAARAVLGHEAARRRAVARADEVDDWCVVRRGVCQMGKFRLAAASSFTQVTQYAPASAVTPFPRGTDSNKRGPRGTDSNKHPYSPLGWRIEARIAISRPSARCCSPHTHK